MDRPLPTHATVYTLLFLGSLGGCSSDGDPVSPGAGIELRPAYHYYSRNDHRSELHTSPEHLAIKFHESVPQPAIDEFLTARELTVRRIPREYAFNLYIVSTDDAFDLAPRLSKESATVEYVGPVFEATPCDDEPTYRILGNRFVLNGDVTDLQVASWLDGADATFIARHDGNDWSSYALPWGDAGFLFDFANALHRHPAIEFAQPVLVGEGCF